MKAAVQDRYGPPDVVRIVDLPDPVPGAGEILVRVCASTVASADARIRAARFPAGMGPLARLALGLRGPRARILGTDLSGEVVALGAGVTRWRVGDRVIALVGAGLRCHAGFRVLKEGAALAPLPPGLGWAEAAALPFGASTALHFLDAKARLAAGERLLVIGAAGAVGSAAVQVGRARGAHVTGVASVANHALLRDLGADTVIDYHAQDVTRLGEAWDVILDMVGQARIGSHGPLLRPGGRLILGVADLWQTLGAGLARLPGGRWVIAGPAPDSPALVQAVARMAAEGRLRPVIDRCHPLDGIAAAHAHVDGGHKRGSVVVLIAPEAAAPDGAAA
ncbi:MAG TPA: NAD(P)-dependent alcohol dehydrogenase [Paracoccaceae bacterium]|nr:NAD(P)-dependent alcohol dehydrogenase [Paracoccaceae bacterium]